MIDKIPMVVAGLAFVAAAASEVPVLAIIGVLVALGTGIAGTYGYLAKRKDEAAAVWRNIAEAYKAESLAKDEQLTQLKAEREGFKGDWMRSLSREIGEVVGHIVAEELRRDR